MAKLTTKQRKAIPKSDFGIPSEKKYPMPDLAHAKNAKARAQQQYEKGNLSKSELLHIERMANKIIKRSGGNPSKAGIGRASDVLTRQKGIKKIKSY